MANDNFPRGLRPLLPDAPGRYYQCDTATDLFIGMPVQLANDGEVVPAAVGVDGTVVLGVIGGFTLGNASGQNRGSAIHEGDPFLDVSDLGGVTAYAFVYDQPSTLFIAQEDTGGSALAQTNVGNSVHLVYRATSGNTTTGYANLEIDRSTAAADTGGSFLLLGLHDAVNADGTRNTAGNYAQWVLQILHHQRAYGEVVTVV